MVVVVQENQDGCNYPYSDSDPSVGGEGKAWSAAGRNLLRSLSSEF